MKFELLYRAEQNKETNGDISIKCLYGSSFSSASVGWVIGSGQVLITNDSGKSWSNLYSPKNYLPYSHAHRIFCKNSKECWIPNFIKRECCFTLNNGKSWDKIELDEGATPADIFFINSKCGWIIGDENSYQTNLGKIYLTTDSGENWKVNAIELQGKVIKLKFIDENTGYFLENFLSEDQSVTKTNLYLSKDGGIVWNKCAGFDQQILDFDFLGKDQIILAGEEGYITISNDYGKNWREISTDGKSNINAVSFYDKTLGLAVGDFGGVLCSEDGGNTWFSIKNKLQENFVSLHFTGFKEGIIISSSAIYSFRL